MSSTESRAQRSSKRKREDSNSVKAAPLTRSEIWMPFGDVVIQAESTQFKVNRDILIKHSTVFQGLFLVPQTENEEVVEGCPIVKLSDSAKDVGLLLAALYDPFHHKVKQPFEVVSMELRLGRKYEITTFRVAAITRLHTEFPTTVRLYNPKKNLQTIDDHPGVYVDLLDLVYNEGLSTCIPSLAFKCLELYTLAQLFAGLERADGSTTDLPDSTKIMLALDKERLHELNEKYKREIEAYVAPAECDCSHCAGVKFGPTPPKWLEGGPLKHLFGSLHSIGGLQLCSKCQQAFGIFRYRLGSEAWKELPGAFGLPGWTALKDFD
ncbi:hypothetical protein C8R46DRAFT_1027013 [Mycena filopes]|nr:hypothetical protein C8R46DRAFT_1027013 [Mycena filopes]